MCKRHELPRIKIELPRIPRWPAPAWHRYLLTLLIILSLLWLEGCQSPFEFRTKAEIEKEVLDVDPAFSNILDEKAKLDQQIGALKAEFRDKKKLISERISSLKEELNSAKRYMDSRISAIDSQLDPYREELRLKIKKLTAELKLKESSLFSTRKTINKLSKLTQQKQPAKDLAEEGPDLKERISFLEIQAQGLERELSLLRDKIRINHLKLRLLR